MTAPVRSSVASSFQQQLEAARRRAGLGTLAEARQRAQSAAKAQASTPAGAPAARDTFEAAKVDYAKVKVTLPDPPTDPAFVNPGVLDAHVNSRPDWATADWDATKCSEIIPGKRPGEGLLNWEEQSVNELCEYGRKTGAVNDAIAKDAALAAKELTAHGPVTPESLAAALAQRLPADRLQQMFPQQLVGAAKYVNSGTYGDPAVRLQKVIEGWQTMDKAGTPPTTRLHAADLALNGLREEDHTLDGRSMQVSYLLSDGGKAPALDEVQGRIDQLNLARVTPGKHELEELGSAKLKLNVSADGTVSGEVSKPGFWSKLGHVLLKVAPIALGVVGFAFGGVGAMLAKVANGAISAVKGIKNGDWLGAIGGIAGGIAGGIGAAAGGVATSASRVFDGIASVARGASGALSAVKSGSLGGLFGAVASGAAGVADFLGDGASAAANSLRSFAEKMGYASRVGSAVDAARSGDLLGAAGSGLDGVAGFTGNARLATVANAAGLASAVQSGDWQGALSSGVAFADQLRLSGRASDAARADDLRWSLARAVASGDAEAAARAGDALRSLSQTMPLERSAPPFALEDLAPGLPLARQPLGDLSLLAPGAEPLPLQRQPFDPRSSTANGNYQVLPGDTLSQIASRFGVSTQALAALNPQLGRKQWVYANQKLFVPGADVVPDGSVSAQVTSLRLDAQETQTILRDQAVRAAAYDTYRTLQTQLADDHVADASLDTTTRWKQTLGDVKEEERDAARSFYEQQVNHLGELLRDPTATSTRFEHAYTALRLSKTAFDEKRGVADAARENDSLLSLLPAAVRFTDRSLVDAIGSSVLPGGLEGTLQAGVHAAGSFDAGLAELAAGTTDLLVSSGRKLWEASGEGQLLDWAAQLSTGAFRDPGEAIDGLHDAFQNASRAQEDIGRTVLGLGQTAFDAAKEHYDSTFGHVVQLGADLYTGAVRSPEQLAQALAKLPADWVKGELATAEKLGGMLVPESARDAIERGDVLGGIMLTAGNNPDLLFGAAAKLGAMGELGKSLQAERLAVEAVEREQVLRHLDDVTKLSEEARAAGLGVEVRPVEAGKYGLPAHDELVIQAEGDGSLNRLAKGLEQKLGKKVELVYDPLALREGELAGSNAFYDPGTGRVYLNRAAMEHLDSADDILLHEIVHAKNDARLAQRLVGEQAGYSTPDAGARLPPPTDLATRDGQEIARQGGWYDDFRSADELGAHSIQLRGRVVELRNGMLNGKVPAAAALGEVRDYAGRVEYLSASQSRSLELLRDSKQPLRVAFVDDKAVIKGPGFTTTMPIDTHGVDVATLDFKQKTALLREQLARSEAYAQATREQARVVDRLAEEASRLRGELSSQREAVKQLRDGFHPVRSRQAQARLADLRRQLGAKLEELKRESSQASRGFRELVQTANESLLPQWSQPSFRGW